MYTVKIDDAFYVEVDNLNHTLRRKVTVKNDDGEERIKIKTIGYSANLPQALERYAKLRQEECLDGQVIEGLDNYINKIKEIDRETFLRVRETADVIKYQEETDE